MKNICCYFLSKLKLTKIIIVLNRLKVIALNDLFSVNAGQFLSKNFGQKLTMLICSLSFCFKDASEA